MLHAESTSIYLRIKTRVLYEAKTGLASRSYIGCMYVSVHYLEAKTEFEA